MVDTNRLHEVSPQQLWQRLTQLRQRLLTGMEGGLSALSALDLTLPQAMALFRLVERGPLTVSELQKAVGRSQAATSHLVTQLSDGNWYCGRMIRTTVDALWFRRARRRWRW